MWGGDRVYGIATPSLPPSDIHCGWGMDNQRGRRIVIVTKEGYERFSLTLPEDLNDWLYAFSLRVKRSGGYRIPKTLIIRAFIRAIKESDLEVDLSNLRDPDIKGIRGVDSQGMEDELVRRLVEAFSGQSRETQ